MIQCPVVAQGYRASSSAEMLSIRNTAICSAAAAIASGELVARWT
jgi:hypothetical protein